MRKLALHTTLSLAIAAALPLAAGADDDGPRFLDRELLVDTLTLDEQEDLPGALAELSAAETALRSATLERDAAVLRVGELEAELVAAKTALNTAETAKALDPESSDLQGDVDAAMAYMLDVEKALDAARDELVDKQTAVGEKQEIFDEKAAVVEGIENEIAATQELVDDLSDKQVQAFNAALHSSVKRGLLPYDIDSGLLQRAVDESFGSRQIHHLVTAFRKQAQFEQMALRFEDSYLLKGKDHFLAKAGDMQRKGTEEFGKFMEKVNANGAKAEAKQAAKEAVSEESRASARGLARGKGHTK